MTALLYIGALVLAFVCLLTVLVILMQRPSANAGMGAALGGGAAESAFGGEAGNVLTKTTNVFIIAFLGLSLALFLGFKAHKNEGRSGGVIKTLTKSEPAPAAPVLSPAKPTTPSTPATPATTPAPAASEAAKAPATTPAK